MKTALITGASAGIGEALAQQMAQQGYNLVLVARSQDRLQSLAQELSQAYDIQTYPLPADLAHPQAPAQIQQQVQSWGLHIDVLINNAGLGAYGEFAASPLSQQMQMVQVNMVALTELTHRFLPFMLQAKRGHIMNVASTAAFMPGPLMTVYYASKAYVLSFSEALQEELKGSGVKVLALCPGPVRTNFQSTAQLQNSKLVRNQVFMDAPTVAQQGLKAMFAGQTVLIPGVINQLQALSPRFLPRAIVPAIVKRAQDRH